MNKRKKGRPQRTGVAASTTAEDDDKSFSWFDPKTWSHGAPAPMNSQAVRETVESIVVAVILAFLFRGFLAEAFVIPTGSMAPTLQGRHKDLRCEKCQHWYRVGASSENADSHSPGKVRSTTCPICRYTMSLNLESNKHASFSGDRILVSKFSYDLREPERWDVIVFKYPGNAVQNYIKRLVGLPNETIRIYRGDISARKSGKEVEPAFTIQRKPNHKLLAMLQLVDDTKYIAPQLQKEGWPSRWQAWSPGGSDVESRWEESPDQWGFSCSGDSKQELMLRYHHLPPSEDDWDYIEKWEKLPPGVKSRRGQLITDFYAYNAGRDQRHIGPQAAQLGMHWVGDLAIEADVEVQSAEGELILDLVEGGVHFQCRVDVSGSGVATLKIVGAGFNFTEDSDRQGQWPTGKTVISKPGKYRVRFSNVDNELRFWVNGRAIALDSVTTYDPPQQIRPVWTAVDPGDLAPAGIGSKGIALHLTRLRIYRDIYYVAVNEDYAYDTHTDYNLEPATIYTTASLPDDIRRLFQEPEKWSGANLFNSLRKVEFRMDKDQFFPMGDNSPASKDARIWSQGYRYTSGSAPFAYVERKMLIGKAVLIYWPHPWHDPIPFLPNVGGMGLIR